MGAFPMPDIRAETVADNILKGWISRFGIPLVITTDQGTQFEAQLFQELSKLIGFKRNKTTTYHPQANGCIERWHCTFNASIMCHENKSWTRSPPIILLGLRTIWRADFEAVSAKLLNDEKIRLPCNFFEDTLFQSQSEFVQTLKATIKDFKPPSSFFISQQAETFYLQRPQRLFSYRSKPCFSYNSSESDIESSIGEDTPNKPVEMPEKKNQIRSIAPSYFNQSDKRWTSSSFTKSLVLLQANLYLYLKIYSNNNKDIRYKVKDTELKMAAKKHLEVGDLVWAKMKCFPFWPAKIVNPAIVQKKVLSTAKGLQKKNSSTARKAQHYVFFLEVIIMPGC
ncbi:retrotransposable element Tf2 155 kDa protein type 1 [Trichonephila clavipes]|nr:retrotransposable element Tf2 155 kDa protein type 1 [Trichonephila clavipes]